MARGPPHVRPLLRDYAAPRSRIKVGFRHKKNGHISVPRPTPRSRSPPAIIVALLDHDDELSEHALSTMVEETQPRPIVFGLLYSDEDKMDRLRPTHSIRTSSRTGNPEPLRRPRTSSAISTVIRRPGRSSRSEGSAKASKGRKLPRDHAPRHRPRIPPRRRSGTCRTSSTTGARTRRARRWART